MHLVRGNGKYPNPAQRPFRVAFFLGSDITSHLVANRLIPIFLDEGMSVLLCLTRGKFNPSRPQTLRHLFFVEHVLLQDHAYPFVDAWGVPQPGHRNTPAGWLAIAPGQVTVCQVPDVNDPAFVTRIADENIDLAVSVRCYQKFRPPILEALGAAPGSAFVNLHPGLLPFYRGVNTFLWAMLEGEREAGFTLHHLSRDWDTGPVIGQARFPLDYSHSVVENMLLHTADAAGLILDLARRMRSGRTVPAAIQDESRARYFSYPTETELARLASREVDVFRASAVIDLLVDAFFKTVPDIARFRQTLIDATADSEVPCGYVMPELQRAGAGEVSR